jgi:hypothetical protein
LQDIIATAIKKKNIARFIHSYIIIVLIQLAAFVRFARFPTGLFLSQPSAQAIR